VILTYLWNHKRSKNSKEFVTVTRNTHWVTCMSNTNWLKKYSRIWTYFILEIDRLV